MNLELYSTPFPFLSAPGIPFFSLGLVLALVLVLIYIELDWAGLDRG